MTRVTETVRMDDGELTGLFRTARDKRSQIRVLADLNLCSPFEIAQRLERLGALKGTKLQPAQFSAKYSPILGADNPASRIDVGIKEPDAPAVYPFDEERAWELWRAGVSDDGMAYALETTVYQIEIWRWRHGLKRPTIAKTRRRNVRQA